MADQRFTPEDLERMAVADDLHISPFREDGKTYGTPTWIWSVAVDGDLSVRAYNGQNSTRYTAARKQKAGRLTAAGMTKEVSFEPIEVQINSRTNDACVKYRHSPYLNPMIGQRARAATVKILPREVGA